MLHALQKVLVMGDVEDQGQLRRGRLAGIQRCCVEPVGGAGLLQAAQAGTARQRGGQAGGAVEPELAIDVADS